MKCKPQNMLLYRSVCERERERERVCVDTFNKTLSHVLTFSKLIFRVLYSLLAMIDSIDWLQNRHSFMTVKSEL